MVNGLYATLLLCIKNFQSCYSLDSLLIRLSDFIILLLWRPQLFARGPSLSRFWNCPTWGLERLIFTLVGLVWGFIKILLLCSSLLCCWRAQFLSRLDPFIVCFLVALSWLVCWLTRCEWRSLSWFWLLLNFIIILWLLSLVRLIPLKVEQV